VSECVCGVSQYWPITHSPRLMSWVISHAPGSTITLVSAYASTLASPEDAKDEFYDQLDRVPTSVPYHHELILMGDFNARVGRDSDAWKKILGKHGLGNENSNGTRLLYCLSALFTS